LEKEESVAMRMQIDRLIGRFKTVKIKIIEIVDLRKREESI